MFYCPHILSVRERGKLSRCWLAATISEKMFKAMCKPSTVKSIDICVTCEEILKIVQEGSMDRKKRFSLYLSAQLMYGATKILYYQTVSFQNHLFEIRKKLEYTQGIKRHIPLKLDERIFELPEPPEVDEDFNNAQLDENLHLLRDEPDLNARMKMLMQDATCADFGVMSFGTLTDEQLAYMLSHDGDITLETLEKLEAVGHSIQNEMTTSSDVSLPGIEDFSKEQPIQDMEEFVIQERIEAQRPEIRAIRGDSTTQRIEPKEGWPPTPQKRRRSGEEDEERLAKKLRTTIEEEAPAYETAPESRPAVEDLNLELELLDLNAGLRQKERRTRKWEDRRTQIKTEVMQAQCRNVKAHCRDQAPSRHRLPPATDLFGIPTLCGTRKFKCNWNNQLRSAFEERICLKIEKELLREEPQRQDRAPEATRLVEAGERSGELIPELSAAIVRTSDVTEQSKSSETILPETSIPRIPEAKGLISETSIGLQLPEITAEGAAIEKNISVPQTRRGSKDVSETTDDFTLPAARSAKKETISKAKLERKSEYKSSESSEASFIRDTQNAQLTKQELLALLEIAWRETNVVNFGEVISPQSYTRFDAACCFLYLLELQAERKVMLQQASPSDPIWVQKYPSPDNGSSS